MFELLGATGLLVSDPIGLRWSDLVLDGSTPYLHVKLTPDRCDLAACLELVRRRGPHSNTDREKSRFPIFVVDGRYGISGAQPAETFTQALERVHTSTARRCPEPPAKPAKPIQRPRRRAAYACPMEESWGFEEGSEIAPRRSVVRKLGGGHRYEVFLVWDGRLFALVVAKVLRPHLAAEERYREELREEAEALARLAHPVIVRGFGAVVDGPYPHLLIEHLEGPTLRRLIRRGGPVPLEQLLPLAAHVAAALHYMAEEGMVHLDVKPDNIVMGVPPRLIDLSIARTLEHAARARRPLGTDAYMPPEQCVPADHPGAVGPASDVWGLAATLHHAISGAVPFPRPRDARDSEDPLVRFPQLETRPRPLPGGTPEPLRALIERALEKDPAQRPQAAELAMELEPLVAELPRKLTFGRWGARTR